jgi:hypothetical protein
MFICSFFYCKDKKECELHGENLLVFLWCELWGHKVIYYKKNTMFCTYRGMDFSPYQDHKRLELGRYCLKTSVATEHQNLEHLAVEMCVNCVLCIMCNILKKEKTT